MQRDHTNRLSLPQKRYPEHRAQAVPLLYFGVSKFRVSEHVSDMHGLSFQYRSPDDTSSPMCGTVLNAPLLPADTVSGRQMVGLTLLARYDGHIGFAQVGRQFGQRIQHGLQIEGRAADDLEHVGGGGLLLKRFAQLV